MSLTSIILSIYIWSAVGVLLFFLFAIARFYEKKSGQRTFSFAFLIAAMMFGVGMLRHIFLIPAIGGDLWVDTLRFIGGLIVAGCGFFLLRLMTGGRPK